VNTPRLAPLEQPWPPQIAEILATYPQGPEGPIALFRTLAHSERTLRKLSGVGLLDRGSPLSIRQREILILRTSARCRCPYEWGVHVKAFATKAGLDDARIADTLAPEPDAALWTHDEQLLFALADQLHEDANVDDALWSELAAACTVEQIMEMLLLCGFYHMIAYLNNALRVAQEPGTPGFGGARPFDAPDSGVRRAAHER
jgi:alkylhydroperoxidase family enzyme